jgi:protein-S-isoprenylcysteine O-methyltransferase Ste14
MIEPLRSYFLLFYAIGLIVLLAKTVHMAVAAAPSQYQPSGARRYLPAILIPLEWVVPPVAIFLQVGEVHAEWLSVRACGVLLSLYAGCMLLWAPVTLGRFLVPRAVVFRDHALITTGPYRFVRHPIYSGNLALLLGSALGTLNLVVLAIWPIEAVGILMEARVEEELLESKFGIEYRAYARRTGRLIPRFGAPGS